MPTFVIQPGVTASVTVPAGNAIATLSNAIYNVSTLTFFNNEPSNVVPSLVNGTGGYTSAAFNNQTIVYVAAGSQPVFYNVGSSPVVADPTNGIFSGNVTIAGLLYESSATGIIAGTTRTQAGATVLTKEVNRVDTSTAPAAGSIVGDGVLLPASGAGLDVTVINNTANIIAVYPSGTDQINGLGASLSIPIPPGDVAQFECAIAGDWRVEPGMGGAGALPVVLAASNIAAAGSNQAGATQLVADFNKITTATGGSAFGVRMPVAVAGMDILVENHSGISIQVYGNGTDQINDVAGATGVVQMDSSVVIFTCYEAGKWYTNGLATGYAKNPTTGTVLETMQYADLISAAGTSQATATPLSAAINNITTVASGTGVNLPASAPGLSVVVQNSGANPLLVYPLQGASDTINGAAATSGILLYQGAIGVFNCTTAGAWIVQPGSTRNAAYNANAATTSATLTAANITGGIASVDLQMTGALAAGATATLPTVAQMVAALHSPVVGTSYRLRVINSSSGAFAWTIAAGTGFTLNGTMTVAQNTWREFVVTLNTLTTATLQSVATGTYS